MKQLGWFPIALLLCGCAHEPAATPVETTEPTADAVRTSSLLTGPEGWHPVDPGDDNPNCLVRLEPDDPALNGAVLILTAREVPGFENVVLAADCELRLKADLPRRWGEAGYRLQGTRIATYGGEELVVFDSQLGGTLGTLVGKQYCTHRGTMQYVLSGWAPQGLFAQVEPVFEAAAKSLKLPSGADS